MQIHPASDRPCPFAAESNACKLDGESTQQRGVRSCVQAEVEGGSARTGDATRECRLACRSRLCHSLGGTVQKITVFQDRCLFDTWHGEQAQPSRRSQNRFGRDEAGRERLQPCASSMFDCGRVRRNQEVGCESEENNRIRCRPVRCESSPGEGEGIVEGLAAES